MTVQNKKSGTEVAQTMAQTDPQKIRRVGRSHVDYWTPRLKKRSYLDREGRLAEIPEWQVRIAHLGRREWFNTGTANKAAGADKARKIYLSLISKGWEATLDEFKPDMQVSKDGCTVGEFLDQVKAVSGLKPVTYEIYAKKFRSLVAGVFGIDGGKAKHDYVNGGHKEWLARVCGVRLDRLAPDKVNEWKVRELKAARSSSNGPASRFAAFSFRARHCSRPRSESISPCACHRLCRLTASRSRKRASPVTSRKSIPPCCWRQRSGNWRKESRAKINPPTLARNCSRSSCWPWAPGCAVMK